MESVSSIKIRELSDSICKLRCNVKASEIIWSFYWNWYCARHTPPPKKDMHIWRVYEFITKSGKTFWRLTPFESEIIFLMMGWHTRCREKLYTLKSLIQLTPSDSCLMLLFAEVFLPSTIEIMYPFLNHPRMGVNSFPRWREDADLCYDYDRNFKVKSDP